MPGKNQTYGQDYKTISIVLPPRDHRAYKIKSAELDIPINEVVRLALADDRIWKRAARSRK
jgi:hypothetical protein